MKLSVAWIFDHIGAKWQDVDINQLVAKFNCTTAEIEKVIPVSFNLDNFYIAQQKTITSDELFIPEIGKQVAIGKRENTVDLLPDAAVNITFLVKKEGNSFVWASLQDFGMEKDGLVPALDITTDDLLGGWRKKFETKDMLLEVDNKTITHRPDMWGHRGFAREVAAILKLPFLPEDHFLKELSVDLQKSESKSTQNNPIAISNQDPEVCKKFNGLYFSSIENKPSHPFIVSRLLKIGARPINGIVDLTNYVTHDWSQPVHAYDADKIEKQQVVIRKAKAGEKLLLLDSNELELTENDTVIADGNKPMCLAGVKGGMHDSVGVGTKSIFFEAANFESGAVRRSALRHKTRTDSSARFEKTLDPNQAVEAVMRFVRLLEDYEIQVEHADEIVSLGDVVASPTISVDHSVLENRLGATLTPFDIIKPLSRLEFKVQEDIAFEGRYNIVVPTFRATKDIAVAEDILEEVARLYGFDKIQLNLPRIFRRPFNLEPIHRKRKVFQYMAYGANMVEQQNYAMADEQSLASMGIELPETITIVNPVSEHYKRLVTSLVPGLLKNVTENLVQKDSLNFFEVGKIWRVNEKKSPIEKQAVAGIFFEKRRSVDFYEQKKHINNLLISLGLDESLICWQQLKKVDHAWYKLHQTACVSYDGKNVGSAGKIDPQFIAQLDALPESDAFIFELDLDFLLSVESKQKRYKPLSKYQDNSFDLSLFVPLELTTRAITNVLGDLNELVHKVELIDFFENVAWPDKRSLTFRIYLSDVSKTLEHKEVEKIRLDAIAAIQSLGAQLRG